MQADGAKVSAAQMDVTARNNRIASELLLLAYRNNRASVLVNLAATVGVAIAFSGQGQV